MLEYLPEYEPDDRVGSCEDRDAMCVQKIEVSFQIPCWVTADQQRRIGELFSEIIRAPSNQPREGVHWLAEVGGRPKFSKTDAMLLGVTDPNLVDETHTGEPTFDDSVLHFGSCARGFVSEKERRSKIRKRVRIVPEHVAPPTLGDKLDSGLSSLFKKIRDWIKK